jgi:hypothetical protein
MALEALKQRFEIITGSKASPEDSTTRLMQTLRAAQAADLQDTGSFGERHADVERKVQTWFAERGRDILPGPGTLKVLGGWSVDLEPNGSRTNNGQRYTYELTAKGIEQAKPKVRRTLRFVLE